MDLNNLDFHGLNMLHEGFMEFLDSKVKAVSAAQKEGNELIVLQLEEECRAIESNLYKISAILESKRKVEIPKFSEAEIYLHAGQFDKYIWIEVYPLSEAYHRFGQYINGTPIYTKVDRDRLEQQIKQQPISKEDGRVRIDAYVEQEDLKRELHDRGILASDIFEIRAFAHEPNQKTYNQKGVKEIPNKLVIPIQFNNMDWLTMPLLGYEMMLERGHLLETEMTRYCVMLFINNSNKLTEELKRKYILNETGERWQASARFALGHFLSEAGILEKGSPQLTFYLICLSKRLSERMLKFRTDMGISERQWEAFKLENTDKANMITGSIVHFEPRSLSYCITKKPIYFDLDRYIHVYSRHCNEFFLEGTSTKQQRATRFQYAEQDINHIISQLLKAHAQEIDERLDSNQTFRLSKENPFYYNGNHYVIRINEDGLIQQFHALEDGEEED